MKNSIKAITIGALTAGMVAVPAVGAFATTAPVTAPEITSVYTNGHSSPLGQSGANLTAYIQDGTATIGGAIESPTALTKVALKSAGKTLCTDTTIEGTAGSYVFSCDVVVPKGDTIIKAVAFQGKERATSEQNLRLTNYGTTTPVTDPVATVDPTRPTDPGFTVTPPASAGIDAPKVSLVENFGLQRRASILIQGQKLAGSEFVVTLNGKQQRLDASGGQAVAFVESTYSGSQSVRVVQVSGSTTSAVGMLQVKFGESTGTPVDPAPVDPVSPVAPVDPTRPTDPGFAVTPPASSTIDAPKVSLIENFGLQRRAAILIQGQKLDGSEFVVTFNGKQERLTASSGQTFTIVESKASGPQTVRVQQVAGNTTSATTLFQVNFF